MSEIKKDIKSYEICKNYKDGFLLLKSENTMMSGNKITIHKHIFHIVNETEDSYEVVQGPIIKISKSDLILDEVEATYKTILYRLQEGLGISKSHQNKYPELIEKVKIEYPQYFI